MSSIMKVDNIQNAAGGDGVHITGHLVQRVSTKFSTAYTNSTQNFSDIAGASITFTPKYASSLLCITFNTLANVYTTGTNTNAGGVMRILHDGAYITGDYNAAGNYEMYFQNDAGAGTGPNNYMRQVKYGEIAAGNTNARVIKVQGRTYNGTTQAIRINQGGLYTSYFVVEEIAQ